MTTDELAQRAGLPAFEDARKQAEPGERVLDVWARLRPDLPVLALFALGYRSGRSH